MPSKDLLPDADQLYSHLLSELEYLRGIDADKFVRNRDYVISAHEQLKQGSPEEWVLDINPNWVFEIGGEVFDAGEARDFSNNKGKAAIGGKISVEDESYQEYSLSLTLLSQEESDAPGREVNRYLGAPCCWNDGDVDSTYRVARRYHFDIDIGDNDDEVKPISHLQNGGKFNSDHLVGTDPHYCSSALDKPRLPHPPMDPLLILNMIATQYTTLKKLVQGKWNREVRKAEEELWKPYHTRISGWYSQDSRSETFASYIDNGEDDRQSGIVD